MTADSWILSLEKPKKYVNVVIIQEYRLGFEPGTYIATLYFTAPSLIRETVCAQTV
jgi:hypothetical protein